MTANPLGHLTVSQLEAAEDYLGVALEDVAQAHRLRQVVIGAWAVLLRNDPTTTLAQTRELSLDRLQELAGTVGNGQPGEA